MWKRLIVGLLFALLGGEAIAATVIDDFTSGLFVVTIQEDTIEEISISQDLTGVLASSRRVYIDDLQIRPEAIGTTALSVEGDGAFRFRTDFIMELLTVRWAGFSFDATEPGNNVLVLDFADFTTPTSNLHGFFTVSLQNTPFDFLQVAEIGFGDLLGQASVVIPLDGLRPDDEFDSTAVDGISVASTHITMDTEFTLRSIVLVPEPAGLSLSLLEVLCLSARRRAFPPRRRRTISISC